MWQVLEQFKILLENLDNQEFEKLLFNGEEKKLDKDIEKVIVRIKELVYQILPISIILYMSDHLSTPKLKMTLKNLTGEEKVPSKKVFLSLLLISMDFDSALKEIREVIKYNKSYILDTIIYLYLRIYCHETLLDSKKLEKLIKLMDELRDKHIPAKKKLPPFVKDTFRDDLKRERLTKKLRS